MPQTILKSFPITDCKEDEYYRQGSGVQSLLCGLLWQDQNKEQIQNVFKRFLFHYSKAQNSVGTVERESHSVHPLMRLSPKFTLRRKKQQTFSRS
ncbi:neuromedin-S [Trichomycterus rosablanca]|uniref:neuromedin-S n=1 Tax=Trichomycterus rosablanca TaxID=2290929 RepID=UPI002F35BD7B